MVRNAACLLALLIGVCACRKSQGPLFAQMPVQSPVAAGVIDEASGIADSYVNPGFLWVIQDSDQPTELYMLNHNGQHGKKIFIKNVTNRDWEELAAGNGPEAGKTYLYIGEIGDNNQVYPSYAIYRLQEPPASTDTVTQVDKISFTYPDRSHDAEAFFIDPGSKDIYIITKRDALSQVYKLPYPQSVTSVNTAVYVRDLPYNGVVGAAYSMRDGLLIKTYDKLYRYASVGDMLKGSGAATLAYQQEPQGEAVCFANDHSGFFTLSEKAFAPSVTLNFYKRN